jgi:hypothetical protein
VTARALRPLAERFFEKVIPEPMSGCWLWMGAAMGFGYGSIGLGRATEGTAYAHVVSLQLHGIAIPPGAHVRHICDTPPCVNPKHLLVGTQRENNQDMARKRRNRVPHPGTQGAKQWNARLDDEKVRQIRQRLSSGANRRGLAAEFKVSKDTIGLIARGRSWRYVS